MINNFCVCTLTHSYKDRGRALKYTIKSFMDDYIGDRFEWFIWVNITNDEINESLKWAQETYSDKVKFNIHISNVNLGPGGGINRLNEWSKEYEYSIFLEGDWIKVPCKVAGVSHNWIQDSINFLEKHKDITHIQLRKYLDDMDDRQYTFGHWIRPENVEKVVDATGNKYVIMKERYYTNTPCLRRMSSYYDTGVFPLNEYYDENGNPTEHKGNKDWGQAEINASSRMKAAWIQFGNFLHFEDWPYLDNWQAYIDSDFGCKKYELRGHNGCKYGYMTPSEMFCGMCEYNKDFTDHVRHFQSYLNNIIKYKEELKNEGKVITDELIIQRMQEVVENPTINPASINFDEYRDRWIIRHRKN